MEPRAVIRGNPDQVRDSSQWVRSRLVQISHNAFASNCGCHMPQAARTCESMERQQDHDICWPVKGLGDERPSMCTTPIGAREPGVWMASTTGPTERKLLRTVKKRHSTQL